MVMYIVIGVVVVLLILVLFTYNNLVQLRNGRLSEKAL